MPEFRRRIQETGARSQKPGAKSQNITLKGWTNIRSLRSIGDSDREIASAAEKPRPRNDTVGRWAEIASPAEKRGPRHAVAPPGVAGQGWTFRSPGFQPGKKVPTSAHYDPATRCSLRERGRTTSVQSAIHRQESLRLLNISRAGTCKNFRVAPKGFLRHQPQIPDPHTPSVLICVDLWLNPTAMWPNPGGCQPGRPPGRPPAAFRGRGTVRRRPPRFSTRRTWRER